MNPIKALEKREFAYERPSIILGVVILTVYYMLGMAHAQARPGTNSVHPEGWWRWSDQGLYLKSIRALARLDFTKTQHWYPLGYPLLGAPFERLMLMHPFLFVNLTCLFASFAGFVCFALRCGFGAPAAVAAFLLGSLGSESIRGNWIIPWTTTPACAALWMFLACCMCQLDATMDEPRMRRWRRIASIGALAVATLLCRPTDLLMPAIGLALMLWWGLRDRSLRPGDPLALGVGAAILLVPYGLLYLRIYGPHPSQYMLNSRTVGFRFAELPLKTVWLLISPRPWFPSGSGLLERLPWIAAGLAGMLLLPGLMQGNARRGMTLLALMMLSYMALFFSYVDLLPSGLWRYDNAHYFKWVLPGLALFGMLLLRTLLFGPRRPPIVAMSAVLLLSAVRLTPIPVSSTDEARLLQYAARPIDWDEAYFGHERLSDRDGMFDNLRTMRVLPDSQGLRVISLSRPFIGVPVWQDRSSLPIATDAVPKEWGMQIGYGWPCWLPPYPCQRLKLAP